MMLILVPMLLLSFCCCPSYTRRRVTAIQRYLSTARGTPRQHLPHRVSHKPKAVSKVANPRIMHLV